MDSGGVWAFPGTTKWQTSFFSNKHLYKITDLERGGAKNTSTKSQTWGGWGAKKSKQHLYKITNLGAGVRTTTSPTSTFLGSPLGSFWVLLYQFLFSSHTSKINQNDRTRVFKFIPSQPNINQFSLQNQGPLQNDRTRGI